MKSSNSNSDSSFVLVNDESNPEVLHKKAANRAKKLHDQLKVTQFAGIPPANPHFVMDLLKAKIPGLTGLLRGLGRTGGTVSGLVAATGQASQPLQAAGTGFHIAGAVLSAVDFVLIPLVFLAAYIAGEKLPITLSKTARWLYSGVGLGLLLTAILVPVTAPYIGIVGAGMALGMSVISLGNMIYQRNKLKKSMEKTQVAIDSATKEWDALTLKAAQLQDELGMPAVIENTDRIVAIAKELDALEKQATEKQESLQQLHNQYAKDKAKRDKMGFTAFMDKGVAVGLGSVAVIGAILTLFFPVAGLSILAAAGAVGISYAAVRFIGPMVTPYLKQFGNWVVGQVSKKSNDDSREPSPELNHVADEKAALIESDNLLASPEPVLVIAEKKEAPKPRLSVSLLGNKSKEELIQLRDKLKIQQKHMDNLDNQLKILVNHQDAKGVLMFFTHLKRELQAECAHEDLSCVSDLFESSINPALKLLNQAISQIKSKTLKLTETEQLSLENSIEFVCLLLDKSDEVIASETHQHPSQVIKQEKDDDEEDEDDREGYKQ